MIRNLLFRSLHLPTLRRCLLLSNKFQRSGGMSSASEALEQIIRLYDQLPLCGKARDDEYTVLAAIYVLKGCSSIPTVLSLATGTKCIGKDLSNDNGCLLSDSHAEILARRAFVRYLCDSIHELCVNPEFAHVCDCPWSIAPSGALSPKEDWKFHLYISDSPCGDASIYESNVCCGGITGAKLLNNANSASEAATDCRPCTLRTKSGRSDIKSENRTTSMSCSDKICRWCCLGLQGALLSAWTPRVFLSSIAVDQDPSCSVIAQHDALHRAIGDRLSAQHPPYGDNKAEQSLAHIPDLCIIPVGSGFSQGKAAAKFKYPVNVEPDVTAMDRESHVDNTVLAAAHPTTSKKRKRNPLSPCGFSINWQRTVGTTARSSDNSSVVGSVESSARCGATSDGLTKFKGRKVVPVAGGTVEVTIAHTGAVQGSVKKNIGEIGAASRLSRYAMSLLFEQVAAYCAAHEDQSPLCAYLFEQLRKNASDQVYLEGHKKCHEHQAADRSVVAGTTSAGITDGAGCDEKRPDVDAVRAVELRTRYGEFKRQCSSAEHRKAKEEFLAHPIFKDWLCD